LVSPVDLPIKIEGFVPESAFLNLLICIGYLWIVHVVKAQSGAVSLLSDSSKSGAHAQQWGN
jgi:hypothetical protein